MSGVLAPFQLNSSLLPFALLETTIVPATFDDCSITIYYSQSSLKRYFELLSLEIELSSEERIQ